MGPDWKVRWCWRRSVFRNICVFLLNVYRIVSYPEILRMLPPTRVFPRYDMKHDFRHGGYSHTVNCTMQSFAPVASTYRLLNNSVSERTDFTDC